MLSTYLMLVGCIIMVAGAVTFFSAPNVTSIIVIVWGFAVFMVGGLSS